MAISDRPIADRTSLVLVSPRDVRDMVAIYGVPEVQRDSLVQPAWDS